MKKTVLIMMAVILCLGLFSGCGTTDEITETEITEAIEVNGYTVNSAYNDEKMFALDGSDYIVKGNFGAFREKELGIGITLSDAMVKDKNEGEGKIGAFLMDQALGVTYTPQKAKELIPSDEEMNSASEDELTKLWAEVREYSFSLFALVQIRDGNEEDAAYLEDFSKRYAKSEKLLSYFDKTYYFMYNDDISGYELTEDEKEALQGYIEELPELKNKVCIFKPYVKDPNEKFEGTLTKFTSKTMNGEEVSQSIFKDYDITMVNVWATWCGVCVEELPEIQTLYEQLPENVNIISICTDASTETELAQSMIDESGIKYDVIIDNSELEDSFYKYFSAYPTTVFVDKDGNIIGEPQTGLPGEDVVEGYRTLIENALEQIGK